MEYNKITPPNVLVLSIMVAILSYTLGSLFAPSQFSNIMLVLFLISFVGVLMGIIMDKKRRKSKVAILGCIIIVLLILLGVILPMLG